MYRDLWGSEKAAELEDSLDRRQDQLAYEELRPAENNWYRLRRWRPRPGYESWPSLVDLARAQPELGLNENRGEALIDSEREVLRKRLSHFLDEQLEAGEVEPGVAGGLLEGWSGYSAEETREELLAKGGFDEQHIRPLLVRPFDLKWAYLDGRAKLWNRSRPKFQAAARVGSDFLLCRKRSPRALDGAAFLLSASLVDQHVLHKDAYAIPLLLAHDDEAGDSDRLFKLEHEETSGVAWRPNLSRFAAGYLAEMGYGDLDTSRHSARALWLHTLAIGYSPLYLEENADALRADWPRIPLPDTRELLDDSAALGARLGALLDIGTPLPGLDTSTVAHLSQLGSLVCDDGRKPQPADLAVTADWASVQSREQKSGAISKIVLPSSGREVRRETGDGEWPTLSSAQRGLLGEEVVDVYLNATTCWRGIPEAVWNFKIGGFQVLRKWLSYRDEAVLGRAITREEARQFQSIARRLTELVLLTNDLDANYRAATGSFDQESLIDFALEEG